MRPDDLPPSWSEVLADEFQQPYFQRLTDFVHRERAEAAVFPPPEDVFSAFQLTPFDQVRAVLLGQDPYHGEGQAHGLCFSVRSGVTPPPSLLNMFRELESDLGVPRPRHGHLATWAEQGVLMLNTVLTVRAHQPHSHKGQGWEEFTDAVLRRINDRPQPAVFILWGSPAKKKLDLIDQQRHPVVTAAHPSPLSARNGFFGSRPYSRVNEALIALGQEPIDWRLPPEPEADES